jgi:hypothetical protein
VERAQQPRLALATFAEEHEVVAGNQRALHLGQHGVVESQDAGPDRLTVYAFGEARQQILPDFLLDSPFTMTGRTEFADGAGQIAR